MNYVPDILGTYICGKRITHIQETPSVISEGRLFLWVDRGMHSNLSAALYCISNVAYDIYSLIFLCWYTLHDQRPNSYLFLFHTLYLVHVLDVGEVPDCSWC